MPIVLSDWSVSRASGDIRYTGLVTGNPSATYATVIEFHRYLQDKADDASSVGDDEVDITDELPSNRSTDNIITLLGSYNIDDASAEHLYDGSIIQGSGGTEEIYDGIVNFGNADVQIQIIQDGAVLATDWWNDAGGGEGLNPDSAQGISHRFMVKTRTAGADIDGRRLIGTSRTFGKTYAEFSINGTSRGNNVLALTDATDLNNQTLEATIAAIVDITNTTEGYALLDVDNNAVDEEYYSEWNVGANSINTFYEYTKWLTRDGSASTIYGLNGELFRGITHEVVIDAPAGTFSAFEAVSWTGGTGQMLAIDSTTAGTKMWLQLLTGTAPVDNDVITGVSTATAAVNITVTDRSSTISKPFVGASTGSAIIGSYGLGIETSDLSATDKVTDLSTSVITPPNNVTFTVSGLVSGEDRVLVAPWDGVAVDSEGNPAIHKAQTTLSTSLTGVAETSVVVASIPTDTPPTGDIRIELASGKYREIAYISYTGNTYTIASTDFSGDTAASTNNVWIAYIDELAGSATATFTGVYLADRDLVVIVRDGGGTPIKQFISSASLGANGGSISVIRTTDA